MVKINPPDALKNQQNPQQWFQQLSNDITVEVIEERINLREAAKKNRDFDTADAIRNDLRSSGIILEDSPQGTTWRRQ